MSAGVVRRRVSAPGPVEPGGRRVAAPLGGGRRSARMTGIVRTVRGDLKPDALGVTDAHDHLLLASPAIAGTPLDDEQAATREAQAFRAAGGPGTQPGEFLDLTRCRGAVPQSRPLRDGIVGRRWRRPLSPRSVPPTERPELGASHTRGLRDTRLESAWFRVTSYVTACAGSSR